MTCSLACTNRQLSVNNLHNVLIPIIKIKYEIHIRIFIASFIKKVNRINSLQMVHDPLISLSYPNK